MCEDNIESEKCATCIINADIQELSSEVLRKHGQCMKPTKEMIEQVDFGLGCRR